ncbi:hypothetical protein LXL04_036296 [Taraxacum kok-saghyz]
MQIVCFGRCRDGVSDGEETASDIKLIQNSDNMSQTVFSRFFRFVEFEIIGSEIGGELGREPDSRGSCFTGLLVLQLGFGRIRNELVVSGEFPFAVADNTEGRTFGVASSGECRSFTA